MKKSPKEQKLIDATKISLDEWLILIKENDVKNEFLILDCCFPTDEMAKEYLEKIDNKTDKEVKFLISKFLISSGRFKSDDRILEFYDSLPIEKQKQLLEQYTFYQRLISIAEWKNLWPSITWVIDLLPNHPYEAINAIKSHYLAHCQYMTDQRIYGCGDAKRLIEAKYIGHQLPVRQILLDMTSRDFELLTAYLYKKKGYNVTVTPRSRDGGYDVLAIKKSEREYEKLHIECKRYTENVGVSIVRGVLGTLSVENATKAIVVTTSNFTKSACYEAKKSNRLELINLNEFDKDMRKHVNINWIKNISEYILNIKKETGIFPKNKVVHN